MAGRAFERGDAPEHNLGAITARMIGHALDQLLADDAVGKARDIARARHPQSARRPVVDDANPPLEPGQIHGGGQARGPGADHQRIDG